MQDSLLVESSGLRTPRSQTSLGELCFTGMLASIHITETAEAQAFSLRPTIEQIRRGVRRGVGHCESADGHIHCVIASSEDGRAACIFDERPVEDEATVHVWAVFG